MTSVFDIAALQAKVREQEKTIKGLINLTEQLKKAVAIQHDTLNQILEYLRQQEEPKLILPN